MARIIAPNKEYAGVSAGVSFQGGEAHIDDPHLISWFRSHGYEVAEETREPSEKESSAVPAKKRSKKKEV